MNYKINLILTSVTFRFLTFKLQQGTLGPYPQGQTTSTKEKKVKIGSSLGFTAYIGATGFSLKIKTSFVESDGKKSLITRHS